MGRLWELSLIRRWMKVRDSIEHSLFSIALAGILLCAVLFLVLPARAVAKNPSGQSEDITVTLAGAGTEADAAIEGKTAADRAAYTQSQILQHCALTLGNAARTAVSTPMPSGTPKAVRTASMVSSSAADTVESHLPLSYTDYSTLLQIVEAECTGGDLLSKQYVACVVLNRVKDPVFPDTVYDVVWQRQSGTAQFSPTQDGRMGTLTISDSTIEAVNNAITQEDISEGALFFIAREHAASRSVDWFDSELEYLFEYGGHEFYRFRKDS